MKNSGLTKLTIKNAELYSYHGVWPEEKKIGGRFQIDVDMWYDASSAIINDDVKDAVNYEEVLFAVNEILEEESYNLIETIVNEILNSLMEKFSILERITVRLRKIYVPVRQIIDYVETEQTLVRE
ncbi:MAG: dihydroneopterin aldolase [Chloroflexota bacterium]